MEDKDRMLLDEVTKVAKQIFYNLVTMNIPGTYTAAELYFGKNALGERLEIDYNGHDYDTHEISIGEGSGYSFTTDQVFRVMYCLEKCALTNSDSVEKCEAYESGAGREGINDGTNRPKTLDKTLPAELSDARLKIRRFKPRYFIGYTNYHLCEENALERERISNTSVYRTLIRGETKNNILTCRQTCFRLACLKVIYYICNEYGIDWK